MSSLASSQSSLPTTPRSERGPSASSSSPFSLPTSLALSASSFLRRLYSESTTSNTHSTHSQGASDADDFWEPHQQQHEKDHPTESASLGASATSSITNSGADAIYIPPPPPQRRPSPFQPPPLYPLILNGLKPSTSSSSSSSSPQLLSRTLAEEIRLLIPPRSQLLEEWSLAYSLERDGVSLTTLYQRCESWRIPRRGFVVVVKDGNGGVRYPSFSFLLFSPSSSSYPLNPMSFLFGNVSLFHPIPVCILRYFAPHS